MPRAVSRRDGFLPVVFFFVVVVEVLASSFDRDLEPGVVLEVEREMSRLLGMLDAGERLEETPRMNGTIDPE